MGTNIFANIGFSFNKSSTHSVISNITNVKKSVVGLGFVFPRLIKSPYKTRTRGVLWLR